MFYTEMKYKPILFNGRTSVDAFFHIYRIYLIKHHAIFKFVFFHLSMFFNLFLIHVGVLIYPIRSQIYENDPPTKVYYLFLDKVIVNRNQCSPQTWALFSIWCSVISCAYTKMKCTVYWCGYLWFYDIRIKPSTSSVFWLFLCGFYM